MSLKKINKIIFPIGRAERGCKNIGRNSKQQRVLVTAHDAFGYFGRMHGLEVVGLQGLSTDSEIGVSDIQETIGIIKNIVYWLFCREQYK